MLFRSLGISHMTVYNYMAHQELLDGVIVLGFRELIDALEPHFASFRTAPSERAAGLLMDVADELVAYAERRPRMYRFMFQSGVAPRSEDPRVLSLYRKVPDMLADELEPEGRAAARRDAYLFLVLVNGLILGYLSGRNVPDAGGLRKAIARGHELIAAGLSAAAKPWLPTPGGRRPA